MKTSARAQLFDADESGQNAPDFDVAGFTARPADMGEPMPHADEVRAVAAPAGFRSREPLPVSAGAFAPAPPSRRREPRRYRTGRNVQLNIKVRRETLDAFNTLCETRGWVQGETLARALAALERELAESRPTAGPGAVPIKT